MFHASAPLPDAGIFSIGGLALSVDVRNASLLSVPEVLYPRRPALTQPTGGTTSDAGTSD